MVKQKQKAWHHPHFPLANTGWHFNALYMYLISVLCRPKHHASTWYNPSYLCDSGQWQFEGCDQNSQLGGCQKELWEWKSQLGFYTKPVVPGLRWTDGHESQSPCLDWTQQKNGTRLCVRLTQCIIRKDVRLNPEISILEMCFYLESIFTSKYWSQVCFHKKYQYSYDTERVIKSKKV